jgi:D-arabinose 1-dehydrogenase-like Zn-dependent alcohol dehydrogenase
LEESKQEMLDFCGEHNITSDIELIDMQDIKLMIVLQMMLNIDL